MGAPATIGKSTEVHTPVGAAQTYGMALTQCAAVAIKPGLRFSPSSMEVGCQLVMAI
jgi:hypothetical protein